MSQRERRAGQQGFILALLLGLMMIMGIFLMKAMPSVIVEVQRAAEEELIFRGESMARGIRLYQARTGAYPAQLSDLMKLRPLVVRRLYRDPMVPDGEWDLVTAVSAGASGNKTGLPIVGVRSRSQHDSIKRYRGKDHYSEWVFAAVDNIVGVPGAGQPGTSGTPKNSSSTTPAPSTK